MQKKEKKFLRTRRNDLQKNGRIQRYEHIELKNKGLSTRVVRGIHTLLNNCLEQAVAERIILTNPAKGCKLPELEKKEMKILPKEKIGPYLAEAEERGLLAAYYLELTTGLRRGELLALLWTDLDIENKTVSVTKQVNRIKGKLVVSQPKTQNSIRTLAIPQQAVDLRLAIRPAVFLLAARFSTQNTQILQALSIFRWYPFPAL